MIKNRNVEHQKIVLVRHLTTEMNKKGIYMGRKLDPDIVFPENKEFERKIKLFFQGFEVNSLVFYSSPAKRCLQTTSLIKDFLKLRELKVHINNHFYETNFGDLSGMSGVQIKEKYPKFFELWKNSPAIVQFPKGENYRQVQGRAWVGLQQLLADKKNFAKTIIICTHVDIIKMILLKISGESINKKNLFSIENGSISTLVWNKKISKLLIVDINH